MSREGKVSQFSTQDHDQSAIDAILKSFTSRPNVKSTIILSRKDGSIIRATGLPETKRSKPSTSRVHNISQSKSGSNPGSLNTAELPKGDDDAENQGEETSPTQQLAAMIHEFVSASSKLAACVQEVSAYTSTTASDTAYGAGAQIPEHSIGAENDVQLLRMRTKKHEIIIYPDQNYLCCVVQSLPSGTVGGDSS